jgi:hypothetical protein
MRLGTRFFEFSSLPYRLRTMPIRPSRRFATFALASIGYISEASATPVARILRIDPAPVSSSGAPIVTLLVDLTEPRRMSEVLKPCSTLSGPAALTCESDALERPFSLNAPYPFPEADARLTVKIGGQDVPAKLVRASRFGESQNEEGAGTAWLVVLDLDDRGKAGQFEMKKVAEGFIAALGPNDLVNLVVLGERGTLADSSWLAAGGRPVLNALLDKFKEPAKSRERTRPLLTLLRAALSDALSTLKAAEGKKLPLHQALVFLSSGYGGGDPATTGPGAMELKERLTRGELGEPGAGLPKLPLPVVSIMTPPGGYPEYAGLARDFMRSLANPEIGGFFSVIQGGQADHAGRIVDAVRSRFAASMLVRFRLSCVAPSPQQSFSLFFPSSSPAIVGDASFQNVPLGIDPGAWPLDVDTALTRKEVEEEGGIYPGGTLKVFGDFCWGGDITRPEVYFLPPGEVLPEITPHSGTGSADDVRRRLVALDMRSAAFAANENFAEFRVPESDRILHGTGERQASRFVIVDRTDRRSSGLTAGTVIEVRSHKRPVPLSWRLLGWSGLGLFVSGGIYSILRMLRQRQTALATYSGIRVERSPYVAPAPVSRGAVKASPRPGRVILHGDDQQLTVLPNIDLKVGRDGSRVAGILKSPEVSALHATFRLQNGRLFVRDESSHAGTRIEGELIAPREFVELQPGQKVALGPEVFRVELGSST